MARKTIFVSDLTGKPIDEKEAATITIRYSSARRQRGRGVRPGVEGPKASAAWPAAEAGDTKGRLKPRLLLRRAGEITRPSCTRRDW